MNALDTNVLLRLLVDDVEDDEAGEPLFVSDAVVTVEKGRPGGLSRRWPAR